MDPGKAKDALKILKKRLGGKNSKIQLLALFMSILNRCPTSTYDQVCQVVKKELGGTPEEEFDPVPIASASLAQVHVAYTHEGQKFAVKVQYTHMTDTAAADFATVELTVNTVQRFFPSFDYRRDRNNTDKINHIISAIWNLSTPSLNGWLSKKG